MWDVGKIVAAPSAGRYYEQQVAQGREDYYAGAGPATRTRGDRLGSAVARAARSRPTP